jgi:hypothetical protein
MSIKYSEIIITGTPCYACQEYKGGGECPYCAASLCIFCFDFCADCGEEIDFSS